MLKIEQIVDPINSLGVKSVFREEDYDRPIGRAIKSARGEVMTEYKLVVVGGEYVCVHLGQSDLFPVP